VPDEAAAVEEASAAATDVVFSHLDRAAVEDLDVSVSLSDGDLAVEVFLLAPEADADVDAVADDAALAARGAADRVLRDQEEE